uniref:Uncharacterized protein n=1 Tax=Arundo donax TaxID=35708 RepID=A0A0A9CJD5_ARUDO
MLKIFQNWCCFNHLCGNLL